MEATRFIHVHIRRKREAFLKCFDLKLFSLVVCMFEKSRLQFRVRDKHLDCLRCGSVA